MYPLRFALPIALVLSLAADPARGGMINFTYAGSDPDDSYVTSAGPGSFSFADGKTTLGRADLTAFQFAFTITSTDPSLPYTDTFTYTLKDITSFAATLSSTGQLATLSFQTGYESPPDNYLAPEYLAARSLSRGGLVSYFGPGDDAQHGTITPLATAVPEPSSLALGAVAGVAGLVLAGRRRARPAA